MLVRHVQKQKHIFAVRERILKKDCGRLCCSSHMRSTACPEKVSIRKLSSKKTTWHYVRELFNQGTLKSAVEKQILSPAPGKVFCAVLEQVEVFFKKNRKG